MKKIVITEKKEKTLIEYVFNEGFDSYASKIDNIVTFLDKNFFRASLPHRNGVKLAPLPIVLGKDENGQPDKTYRLDLTQLFEVLQSQEEFKNMFSDRNERDKLLKQVINDWFGRKITKYGSLTQY